MADKDIVNMLSDPHTRREGFEEMVRLYGEPLYWTIRRIVLSHDDANDVLQNAFVKAWEKLDTFQGRSSLRTWLYRISVNESLDFMRKKKSEMLRTDSEVGVADKLMADEYFDGDETQALLQQAVASLPEVQRAVFVMKYFEEKKYTEISEILSTSVGALKASYHLAVKKITEYFRNND